MQKVVGIVEDDYRLRAQLKGHLESAGFRVCDFESVEQFCDQNIIAQLDCVVSDLMLPSKSGIELIEYVKHIRPELPVFIVSGRGSIPLAVDAVRKGAVDFLEKPVNVSVLVEYIHSVIAPDIPLSHSFSEIHRSDNSPMIAVVEKLLPITKSNAAVCITGETGTGKEVVARAVHTHSSRRNNNFVAINCGAIAANLLESELFGFVKGAFTGAESDNPGKIKMAHEGTLFLDEIAELPLASQSTLLRVLQEKRVVAIGDFEESPVDFRLISATHKNLFHEVHAGRFREDLYYRLNVFEIKLPPLRERMMDIPLIAQTILQKISLRLDAPPPKLTKGDIEQLSLYHWPGNIRELHNILERYIVTRNLDIKPPQCKNVVPGAMNERLKYEKTRVTPAMILDALERSQGNKTRAANSLHISRGALQYQIKKHDL